MKLVRQEFDPAIPVADLVEHPDNPRRGDDQIVAESVEVNGFYGAVLVQRSTGRVLAGHTRLRVARAEGAESLPGIWLDVDDVEARRIMLADNRTSDLATYDDDLLVRMLADALDDDGSLLGTGYDLDAFEALQLDEVDLDTGGLGGDLDEVPARAPAKTVHGDVWLLGPHRLMCGDSTIPTDVERLMAGATAALLHADPPYGMGKEKDGVANDNLYGNKLDQFQMAWWAACRPYLDDNASGYIWGNPADLWRLWYLGGLSTSERLTFRNEIVWDKGSGQAQNSDEMRSYSIATERCLFFMLGEQGFNSNSENYWAGWEPIRSYLEAEMRRCGWTTSDLNRITGTQMAGHWVSTSQWQFIRPEHYAAIQQAAREHGAFQREYEELKREFHATRAYFDNTVDNMNEVWQYPRVTGADRHGHATPKPVAMIERAIRASAPAGSVVLEPFAGSGSTLIAAEAAGRVCYTMELDAHYCDVICARYQKATGTKPIAEATGRAHDFADTI